MRKEFVEVVVDIIEFMVLDSMSEEEPYEHLMNESLKNLKDGMVVVEVIPLAVGYMMASFDIELFNKCTEYCAQDVVENHDLFKAEIEKRIIQFKEDNQFMENIS